MAGTSFAHRFFVLVPKPKWKSDQKQIDGSRQLVAFKYYPINSKSISTPRRADGDHSSLVLLYVSKQKHDGKRTSISPSYRHYPRDPLLVELKTDRDRKINAAPATCQRLKFQVPNPGVSVRCVTLGTAVLGCECWLASRWRDSWLWGHLLSSACFWLVCCPTCSMGRGCGWCFITSVSRLSFIQFRYCS